MKRKPINMTREELESELADNLRKHPYYNGGTKWAMRRFDLRHELEKREQNNKPK